MEIKRLSKLSKIGVIETNPAYRWLNVPTEEEINNGKIIQVVYDSGCYLIEFIPQDKIQAYESGIDKIEDVQNTSNSKVNKEVEDARKIKLNKDIFANGRYDNTEIGYIIDNDMEYIDVYMQKSTNSFIKDKIQFILDNMR